ncbi:MAG TPA: carboxypeptidase-like regulatory domain-containing protein [Bryobacteraceae bacterium]|nr:carboxypeptidase-like regulatory domain-containing protein [Bryobacteraceae bacterium]
MSRVLAACLAVLILVAPAAFAQKDKNKGDSEHTRSVKGLVVTPDGKPAKQAVVFLKNTKTLQVQSFITRDDGSYAFHELNPDVDYELKAEMEGGFVSPTKGLSSFDSRKQPVIDLKLAKK